MIGADATLWQAGSLARSLARLPAELSSRTLGEPKSVTLSVCWLDKLLAQI